jgi:RHS repeat-associated protein
VKPRIGNSRDDYNVLGNWQSVTDNLTSTETDNSFNLQNEATAYGPSAVSYDDNGNLTEDADASTYTYDAWNRQVDVSGVVSYGYDALGRRITSTPNGGSTTTLYYSSDWQVVEERDSTGATTYQYVWSPAFIDDMLWRVDGSGGIVSPLTDNNHNVVAIINDSDPANVLERYQYDPHGNVTFLNADGSLKTTQASDYGMVYLWQDKREDPLTGQYDSRKRIYNPTTATFNQQDPDGYINGPNLYQADESNPLNRVDPMGTQTILPYFTPLPPENPGMLIYWVTSACTVAGYAIGEWLGTHKKVDNAIVNTCNCILNGLNHPAQPGCPPCPPFTIAMPHCKCIPDGGGVD